MGRRLLWASLVLVPIDLVADVLGAGQTLLFILSAVALVPLAWVIGEATEQTGEHTGPAIAGLLNASFGNAPELIISLFAVNDGLFQVVRGSLTGSIVGNLLLVLGFSLLVGGDGPIDRRTAYTSVGLVALAAALFAIPAVAHAELRRTKFLGAYALPVVGVLFATYVVSTTWSVRQERRKQRANPATGEDADWSLPRSLITLALATLATVAMSEVLTGSIEAFAHNAGLSDFFVAAVIVAIVGNAAEHGGAVVIASHGGVRLASDIALQSATQVALGVIPAVVLLSLAIRPLPLAFRWVEFLALGVAVVVPALLLTSGRSSRWRGGVLLAAYAGVATAFYVAG